MSGLSKSCRLLCLLVQDIDTPSEAYLALLLKLLMNTTSTAPIHDY